MTRFTLFLVLVLAIPSGAAASLGGTVATVDADRARTRSALMRISRLSAYSVHELQSPSGTIVREYYSPAGIVFGVAWDGEWPPDFRQILGTYFDRYQRASQAVRRAHKSRGHLAVNDDGLVVQALGRTRSFSGIAYAPALLPAGVTADVVK